MSPFPKAISRAFYGILSTISSNSRLNLVRVRMCILGIHVHTQVNQTQLSFFDRQTYILSCLLCSKWHPFFWHICGSNLKKKLTFEARQKASFSKNIMRRILYITYLMAHDKASPVHTILKNWKNMAAKLFEAFFFNSCLSNLKGCGEREWERREYVGNCRVKEAISVR